MDKDEINQKISNLIKEKRYEEVSLVLDEYSIFFWREKYNKMTFEEKVKYWSGRLHSQMRWNGESGVDEMAVFSKADYEIWKKYEPEIDELLPHIIKYLTVKEELIYEALKK
jgi:hypothetical protein